VVVARGGRVGGRVLQRHDGDHARGVHAPARRWAPPFQQLVGELLQTFLWSGRLGVRECAERYRDLAAALLDAARC
jgi:hypothetical protein